MKRSEVSGKEKIIGAAIDVIRAKGYSAATVDDICAAAGVSKGSFFHHFESKDALAVEAARQFNEMAGRLFSNAPYRAETDPLKRLLGYLDFRAEILQGKTYEYTCYLGTVLQEVHDTHPLLREACDQELSAHVRWLTEDIQAAKRIHCPKAEWSAESLGYHIQAVLQGAFILAKAKQDPAVALNCVSHLRRYVASLFESSPSALARAKDTV